MSSIKFLLSSLILGLAFQAAAVPQTTPASGNITCELQEIKGKETRLSKFEVMASDDAHGAMHFMNLDLHSQYTGFVSKIGHHVIIHLYADNSDYAYTAHADMSGLSGAAFYQIYMPSSDPSIINAIQITCVRSELAE